MLALLLILAVVALVFGLFTALKWLLIIAAVLLLASLVMGMGTRRRSNL